MKINVKKLKYDQKFFLFYIQHSQHCPFWSSSSKNLIKNIIQIGSRSRLKKPGSGSGSVKNPKHWTVHSPWQCINIAHEQKGSKTKATILVPWSAKYEGTKSCRRIKTGFCIHIFYNHTQKQNLIEQNCVNFRTQFSYYDLVLYCVACPARCQLGLRILQQIK